MREEEENKYTEEEEAGPAGGSRITRASCTSLAPTIFGLDQNCGATAASTCIPGSPSVASASRASTVHVAKDAMRSPRQQQRRHIRAPGQHLRCAWPSAHGCAGRDVDQEERPSE